MDLSTSLESPSERLASVDHDSLLTRADSVNRSLRRRVAELQAIACQRFVLYQQGQAAVAGMRRDLERARDELGSARDLLYALQAWPLNIDLTTGNLRRLLHSGPHRFDPQPDDGRACRAVAGAPAAPLALPSPRQ